MMSVATSSQLPTMFSPSCSSWGRTWRSIRARRCRCSTVMHSPAASEFGRKQRPDDFAVPRRQTMTRLFQRVFVTGGAGYCGSRLVPQLLAHGYYVTVYDIMYFGGHFLPRHHPQLQVIEGDIRDTTKLAGAVAGHDAFVSLACISNDASLALR